VLCVADAGTASSTVSSPKPTAELTAHVAHHPCATPRTAPHNTALPRPSQQLTSLTVHSNVPSALISGTDSSPSSSLRPVCWYTASATSCLVTLRVRQASGVGVRRACVCAWARRVGETRGPPWRA
jgi:hypothetical protein